MRLIETSLALVLLLLMMYPGMKMPLSVYRTTIDFERGALRGDDVP